MKNQSRTRFCSASQVYALGKKCSKIALILAVIFLCLFVYQDTVSACPTCKDAIHGEHDGVAKGYYWSILFLMATPFAIFAGWGIYIYRVVRKMPKVDHHGHPMGTLGDVH